MKELIEELRRKIHDVDENDELFNEIDAELHENITTGT